MPVSKKAKIQREHRAADKAGTRAPVKANGLPVKAPKPTSICANCRKELVNTNLKQLETHAETHDATTWPKEKCWPDIFKVLQPGVLVVEKPTWQKKLVLPAKAIAKAK